MVQVRIDGQTRQEIETSAKRMGVIITKIYPKRREQGFLGYGYLPDAPVRVTVVQKPALPYRPCGR